MTSRQPRGLRVHRLSALRALWPWFLCCVTAVAHAQAPDAVTLEEAKQRFKAGLQLARDNNCEAALAEFRASLKLVPRPNTLYNMAQCHERLNDYHRAVEAYERYLEVAEQDAADRTAVETATRTLRNLLGTIHLHTEVAEAEVWIDNRLAGTGPGDYLVSPGRHTVELRADGYLTAQREVETASRSEVDLTLQLERAEQHVEQTIEQTIEQTVEVTRVEKRGLSPVFFYTGLAVTGLAGLGGGIMGGLALMEKSSAEGQDPRLPRDDHVRRIDNRARVADAMFGTAVLCGVATVVFYFVTDWEQDQPASEPAAVEVRASVQRAGGSVSLGGRF